MRGTGRFFKDQEGVVCPPGPPAALQGGSYGGGVGPQLPIGVRPPPVHYGRPGYAHGQGLLFKGNTPAGQQTHLCVNFSACV